MPDRIQVLRQLAESVNIHDSNRELLQLIVEELEMLRGEIMMTRKVREALRESLR